MAKIRYRDQKFTTDRAQRIVWINRVLAEYTDQRVSVRQVYYRLVAAALIPNQPEEYDKIQSLITDARYAGLIDWDAIEDRNREPVRPEEWKSGRGALDETVEKFRMNRWLTQPFYIELWVEKAALAGVLWPIAVDYHITLMVNRGYSSASAMKESAERISSRSEPMKLEEARERYGEDKASFEAAMQGHRPVILYVGDHDPSGQDMVRDVRTRLLEFDCPSWMDVRPVALTWDQIEEYKPPPNPLKRKDDPKKYKSVDLSHADPRAREYILKHGHSSWEVDALPPKALELIIRTTLNAYIDKPAMEKAITRENIIKAKIKSFSAGFEEPK